MDSRLDHVERRGEDARKATSTRTREYLVCYRQVVLVYLLLLEHERPLAELLVECELQSTERKVARQCGLVAEEQRRDTLRLVYRRDRGPQVLVVVAGVEVRVVVPALQLQPGLQHLRGHVHETGHEISQEPSGEVRKRLIQLILPDHGAFGVLISAEKDGSTGEGPQHRRKIPTVQTPSKPFLEEHGPVRRQHVSILVHIGRSLLPRLHRVQRMHRRVPYYTPNSTSQETVPYRTMLIPVWGLYTTIARTAMARGPYLLSLLMYPYYRYRGRKTPHPV